jgi:hypothetical protein
VLLSTLARERAHRLAIVHEREGGVDEHTSDVVDATPLMELRNVYERSQKLVRGSELFVDLFSRTLCIDIPSTGADAYFNDAIIAQCFPVVLQRCSMSTLVREKQNSCVSLANWRVCNRYACFAQPCYVNKLLCVLVILVWRLRSSCQCPCC